MSEIDNIFCEIHRRFYYQRDTLENIRQVAEALAEDPGTPGHVKEGLKCIRRASILGLQEPPKQYGSFYQTHETDKRTRNPGDGQK